MKLKRRSDCASSVSEQVIAEITFVYQRMSLIELLEEENIMMGMYHKRRLDSERKRIQDILRAEIEKKIR